MSETIDLTRARDEFNWLRGENERRNDNYYFLRQAVKGNFRWPKDWPRHIPRHVNNLCGPISRQSATYLMAKGFNYNVERPNNLEYRQAAERAEKILARLQVLNRAELQYLMGSLNGTQLGRSVYKVYPKGAPGRKYACFSYVNPDFFYGVPSGDDSLSQFESVYYAYTLDIETCRRMFGNHDFKTTGLINTLGGFDRRADDAREAWGTLAARRIPVTEVWTNSAYAIDAGGVIVFNGDNPRKWKATGEGYVPFVAIENNRNSGEGVGEADIHQARPLNELLNRIFSMKAHITDRWLNPTVVWEGAPPNAGEILAATVGGGGFIPARLGAKLSFLAYDKPNQAILEMEQATRGAILSAAGTNELALSGQLSGSINTGPSTANQFQSVVSGVQAKQMEWSWGLKALDAMLLEITEEIGDSEALGSAVVNQTIKSRDMDSGELVKLSGKDIMGLRDVTIDWPGVLPKDDPQAAAFELQKLQGGVQSVYTTLENLGFQYPDDEIFRIRLENQDPSLKGQAVAEQTRANTPLIKAQMDHGLKQDQMQADREGKLQDTLAQLSQQDVAGAPNDAQLASQGNVGARIRQLAASHQAQLDQSGPGEPSLAVGGGAY